MPGGQERQDNLLAPGALAGQLEDSGCRSLFSSCSVWSGCGRRGQLPSSGSGRRGRGLHPVHPPLQGTGKASGAGVRPVPAAEPGGSDAPGALPPCPGGVGPKGLDRERMVEYPTLARRAVSRQLEREMMAEELRLLYVAMTRAQEKLILSVALTEGVRALERLAQEAAVPVPAAALERQQSVGPGVPSPPPPPGRRRRGCGRWLVDRKRLRPVWVRPGTSAGCRGMRWRRGGGAPPAALRTWSRSAERREGPDCRPDLDPIPMRRRFPCRPS